MMMPSFLAFRCPTLITKLDGELPQVHSLPRPMSPTLYWSNLACLAAVSRIAWFSSGFGETCEIILAHEVPMNGIL